jgi:metal-dependent amidase/aminoacylase/carboxypeptidase family protein
MPEQQFDEERFTGEIRKFLKKVGITSQIEIENAVRAALASGKLDTSQPLQAVMVLEVPALGLKHTIEHPLATG